MIGTIMRIAFRALMICLVFLIGTIVYDESAILKLIVAFISVFLLIYTEQLLRMIEKNGGL